MLVYSCCVLLCFCAATICGQNSREAGAYRRPKVRIEPTSSEYVVVKEFDDVAMTCAAEGHPRPLVRWSFVAGALTRRKLDPWNPRLNIRKIRRNEGGRVTCRADNGIGNPALTTKTIKVLYLDTPQLSIHPSRAETSRSSIWFESTVYLSCEVRSNPAATFTWWKDGRKIKPGKINGPSVRTSDPYKPGVSSVVLKIKNANPNDYGNYICRASIGGEKAYNVKDTRANFTYTAQIVPPEIALRTSENLVVDVGDRVKITCDVINGFPRPTITWVRLDGELPTRAEVGGKRATLRISRVQLSDSGTYFCVGSNGVGLPVRKSTKLAVRYIGPMLYWITPELRRDDLRLVVHSEAKITCHADASPYSELEYSWFKLNSNYERIRVLDRIVRNVIVTSLDEEEVERGFTFPEKSSRLQIGDLSRDDYGQYVCEGRLRGNTNLSVSATITISPDSAPSSVRNKVATVVAREGAHASLECVAMGTPRASVAWRREENLTMPSGNVEDVVKDGRLNISRVSREDAGFYFCSPARFNGFSSLRKRGFEDSVELQVLYAPTVDQPFTNIRKRTGTSQALTCNVVDASPYSNLTYVWKKDNVTIARYKSSHGIELLKLTPDNYGLYTCDVYNEVGGGRCAINLTGRAFQPEILRRDSLKAFPQIDSSPGTFAYLLSWTQKNPDSVDPVLEYRVRWREIGKSMKRDGNTGPESTPVPWREKHRILPATLNYGELVTCKLNDLVSGQYEVEVTPKTLLGYGDVSKTMIDVRSERDVNGVGPTLHPSGRPFFCPFDSPKICSFSQDVARDEFDWVWNYVGNQARRTPNTGPRQDKTNSDPHGGYMFIESSTPHKGARARLLSPTFYDRSSFEHCLKFVYHMKGKHIGKLRVLQAFVGTDNTTEVWSRTGPQADSWLQARVNLLAGTAYQIVFEAQITQDNGYEGDIAIDDVLVLYEKCLPSPTVAFSALLPATTPRNVGTSHVITDSAIVYIFHVTIAAIVTRLFC